MSGKQYLASLIAQMVAELANQCDEIAALKAEIETLKAKKPKKKETPK